MKARYLVAIPAFLLFMACNDQNGMRTINNMDRNFATQASNENLTLMDNGRLAIANAEDTRVRQLGQLIVDESGASQVGLQQAAQQAEIPIMLTPGTDSKMQHAQLAKMTGEEFDRAYITATVATYEKMVHLHEMQGNTGLDKGMKAYAKERLPELKKRLAKAKELTNNQ